MNNERVVFFYIIEIILYLKLMDTAKVDLLKRKKIGKLIMVKLMEAD